MSASRPHFPCRQAGVSFDVRCGHMGGRNPPGRRWMTARDMARVGTFACTAALLALTIAAPSAHAQPVSSKDQACITAFNKTLWKIGRTQADLVKRCLREFAAGIPTAIDIETCMRSNRGGKLAAAVEKGNKAIASKCSGVSPAFGVSAFDAASVAAALAPIHLVHGALAQ